MVENLSGKILSSRIFPKSRDFHVWKSKNTKKALVLAVDRRFRIFRFSNMKISRCRKNSRTQNFFREVFDDALSTGEIRFPLKKLSDIGVLLIVESHISFLWFMIGKCSDVKRTRNWKMAISRDLDLITVLSTPIQWSIVLDLSSLIQDFLKTF